MKNGHSSQAVNMQCKIVLEQLLSCNPRLGFFIVHLFGFYLKIYCVYTQCLFLTLDWNRTILATQIICDILINSSLHLKHLVSSAQRRYACGERRYLLH